MEKLSWNNISLQTYFEIQNIKQDNDILFIEKLMYVNELLGIRDYDDEYWDELDSDDMVKEMEKVKFIYTEPKPDKPSKEYIINTITFSTFISLCTYFNSNNHEKFLECFEEDFYTITISRFLYYKNLFIKYYDDLSKTYKVLYTTKSESEDGDSDTKVLSIEELEEEIKKEENAKERQALKNALQKEKNKRNYQWLGMVYQLCNGDLTKYQTIMSTSNILVHSWLAYKVMIEKNML